MTDLTDDEFTVLMIAAEGQSMIPLGRWEKPVFSLTAKAYLRKADDVNFYITEAGRQAIKDRDKEDDQALANVMHRMVTQPLVEPNVVSLQRRTPEASKAYFEGFNAAIHMAIHVVSRGKQWDLADELRKLLQQ